MRASSARVVVRVPDSTVLQARAVAQLRLRRQRGAAGSHRGNWASQLVKSSDWLVSMPSSHCHPMISQLLGGDNIQAEDGCGAFELATDHG